MEMVCPLEDPRSVCGRNFPNFEMVDATIASALKKIIRNSHLKKKVSLEEQKVQKKDRYLRGSLMRCFHVTMSSDLLTREVLGNHFLMETRIICLIKQDLNELERQEHQVGSLDHCIEKLQHTSLCSMIGIAGRTTRKY